MRIIFICTGNTCRSPMAEGFCRQRLQREGISDIEVASRGLMANPNNPPTEKAVTAMARHGIDISGHRARQFSAEELQDDDLLLTMGETHLGVVQFEAPGVYSDNLGDYAGIPGNVPDPFGMEQQFYDKTAESIRILVDASMDRLLREKKSC